MPLTTPPIRVYIPTFKEAHRLNYEKFCCIEAMLEATNLKEPKLQNNIISIKQYGETSYSNTRR